MSQRTHLTGPEIEPASSSARPATIEVQTENGFSIVRRCNFDEQSSIYGIEHCFVVRDPHGYELDITVNFSNACIEEVRHRTFGRLTLESTYWITTAERHLSDYLWEHDDYPPGAQITIASLTLDDIDLAQRWRTDTPIAQRSALSNIKQGMIGLAGLVPLIAALFITAHAQETVFNVPTTDVLDKGKVYFELDVSAKPVDAAAVNRFSSFVPRVVVGAGHRIETGVNILGNVQPGRDSTTISPTIKWKAYDGKDNGWAIVLGDNLFIPVRNRGYDVGTYSYAMTQKTFNKSTRIGFGGYFFSRNVVAPNANRSGGQFTFEQPVSKKVTLAADWFTGRHSAGYFTPGAIFKLGSKITGYAGYTIGNQNASQGNHFFLLEFGYNFN